MKGYNPNKAIIIIIILLLSLSKLSLPSKTHCILPAQTSCHGNLHTYSDFSSAFSSISVSNISSIYASDMDGDDDMDLSISDGELGKIYYYENTGSATAPNFVEKTGWYNPFQNISFGSNSHPYITLLDVDSDGDDDVVISHSSTLYDLYYGKNVGSATQPSFQNFTYNSENPFLSLHFKIDRPKARPHDIDGDGDLDMAVAGLLGQVYWYEKTSSSTFSSRQNLTSSDFHSTTQGNMALDFSDIDGDGDEDMMVFEALQENISFYEAVLKATLCYEKNPDPLLNPFKSLNNIFAREASIQFVDLNGDGKKDILLPKFHDQVQVFQSSLLSPPLFSERSIHQFNKLPNLVDVGDFATVAFVDYDKDGDGDFVLGEKNDGKTSGLTLYQNQVYECSFLFLVFLLFLVFIG